jgi:hypothetical protein
LVAPLAASLNLSSLCDAKPASLVDRFPWAQKRSAGFLGSQSDCDLEI